MLPSALRFLRWDECSPCAFLHLNHRYKQTWRHVSKALLQHPILSVSDCRMSYKKFIKNIYSREVLVSNLHHFIFLIRAMLMAVRCARERTFRREWMKSRLDDETQKKLKFLSRWMNRREFLLFARHFLLPFSGHQITDELNSTKAIKQYNVTKYRWQLPSASESSRFPGCVTRPAGFGVVLTWFCRRFVVCVMQLEAVMSFNPILGTTITFALLLESRFELSFHFYEWDADFLCSRRLILNADFLINRKRFQFRFQISQESRGEQKIAWLWKYLSSFPEISVHWFAQQRLGFYEANYFNFFSQKIFRN